MEEIVFACRPEELSCIVGNLFTGISPPCGITHSGNSGRLVIKGDRCLFYGLPDDLRAVRNGVCPERRCEHGR